MVSPVDVANMALDQIGARFSVTSIDPPGPPNNPNAVVVSRHYTPKMDALHRAAHWNFARKQATLSMLAAAQGTPENPSGTTLPIPPRPYQYEYAYPADCLKARFLIPNPPTVGTNIGPVLSAGLVQTPVWFPPIGYKFAVALDTDAANNQIKVILTDLEYAQLVYTCRVVNPDLWDPHFLAAASATLGAWLVNPLTRNAEVLKEQTQIASGIILQARVSDGNEGVTSIDHVPDWMAVRGWTGMADRFSEPQAWYGWDSMGFPGGVTV
jgi:hypothetical protein